MGYTYTTIDGCRVEVHVAAAFGNLRAAFRAAWGLDLLITDGTRTRAEQTALYQAYLNGGTLAAAPGYSNHEEDGPRGPRALDVHDSGTDRGVVTYGTPRANWLRLNAPTYGFDPAGYQFSQTEPWHIEYVGTLDGPLTSKDSQPVQEDTMGKLIRNTDGTIYLLDEFGAVDPRQLLDPGVGLSETVAALDKTLGAAQLSNREFDLASMAARNRWLQVQKRIIDGVVMALGKAPAPEPGPDPIDPEPEPPASTDPIVQTMPTQRTIRDIQVVIGMTGADVDNQDGPYTRSRVAAWQGAHWLEPDGIWGLASDGTAFPPAGSTPGVDYSFARPDPALLRDRGIKHAGRYLASMDNAKRLMRTEYEALARNGIETWFIYEEDGKELTSFSEGVRVARLAELHRTRENLPRKPIYFNVDYDAGPEQLPGILAALDGIGQAIGLNRVGLYAGYNVIKAAFDAGKITYGFQTYAWSRNAQNRIQWDPRAHLQQWVNGQWGDTVDFTRAVKTEYGQTAVTG